MTIFFTIIIECNPSLYPLQGNGIFGTTLSTKSGLYQRRFESYKTNLEKKIIIYSNISVFYFEIFGSQL